MPKKKESPQGKKDVHVELDVVLHERIKELAEREARSFPRQLARLLETHPDLNIVKQTT